MKKNIKKRCIKRSLLALALLSIIGLGSGAMAFASDSGGELEREFVIEVNSPEPIGDKEDNITIDVNKPLPNPVETGNGFLIDVNKPKEGSTIPKENPYEPTDPSQARGTITESVGADNREYPRRSEITDIIEETSSGQMKERPKADAREFLTFQTKSGKVFHLIINHDEPDSNVQLLTEVSEQDLLNMIEQDQERSGINKVKEEPKKEVVKKEEPEPEVEEPKKEDSKGSFLIVLLIVAGVGGAGYYFKVIKSDDSGFEDFEDDEIPDDDFFSSNAEENYEEDEEKEYTKEDLI
ncbi:CD1107 family mobile element protein [Clostridium cochlearium]|jgi:hypothetical protein|uniref:CD1107 family mobile element protein n=1 Tax=Clostridium cochlearium TaxID=1494 RepID=UPI000DF10843|nr:DUF4366 domain-containing protein [Clostridium cochlearium]STA93562.1 cell surface protein [Clostridium cochlearium]